MALNPPPGPEPTRPASAADLVHALAVACQGYAVDLHPQLAALIGRHTARD